MTDESNRDQETLRATDKRGTERDAHMGKKGQTKRQIKKIKNR